MEIRWRPGGDASLRWLRRRLLETNRVSGESREIHTCSIFWGDFFQSPAGLGDVSATSSSIAATSRRLILAATGETFPRRLRDLLETKETEETLRRRCGDVSATLLDPLYHVTERVLALSRCLHSWSRTSHWRRLGGSTNYFLVSRVTQVAATDQSRQSRQRFRQ